MLCIMLVGCQATDMSITTSKELNKNLNLLMNTVNRLDTVDNDYLVSNDIYSLNTVQASAVPTPNTPIKKILATNNENDNISTLELRADEVSLKDDITTALKNELINRLYCDENGNCKLCNEPYTCNKNNMCNNCNQTIICDSEGNCTTCNKQLVLDKNNNCSSCKKTCVSTTPNSNISSNTSDCLRKISANNEKLKITLLGTENKEFEIEPSDLIIDNNNDVIVNDNIDNVTRYSEDVYKPNKNHITKDIRENNRKTNNDINKNNKIKTYANKKDNVLDNNTVKINAINTLESEDDLEDADNTTNATDNENKYKIIYYSENAYFPDMLRYRPRFVSQINYDTANNNLNRYVNKLQKLYTMTADVVEANNTLANYKVIILDNIDEAKELNNCVLDGSCTPTNNQVQALNNYISDIKSTISNLRNLNGNLTNEINKISTNNTGISQSIDITNSNYLKILNQIDTRISFHENAIATLEQIKYLLQDAQNNTDKETLVEDLNNKQTIIVEEDNSLDENIVNDGTAIDNNIVTNTPVDNDDTITNNDTEDNIIVSEGVTPNTTTNNILDNEIDSSVKSNEEIIETNDTTTNIDTYNNNNFSNVNSYLDNKNMRDNIGNNNIENTINNENNIDSDYLIDDDNIVNNNSDIPQMVGNDNGILSNNNLANTNNLNNGYNNTIISQNNLDNNDLGNNSYRYDNNGTLYNNTNGYNNAGLNNINEKNNNVNTYKYNTLVDSINRGTINNGINTL